jgi:hypothetical protein
VAECNSATGCAAIVKTPTGDYVVVGKMMGATAVQGILGLSVAGGEFAVLIPGELMEKFLEEHNG